MHRLIPIIGIKVWVYIFLNLEIRAIYTKIFQLVFKVLSKQSHGKPALGNGGSPFR